MATKSVARMGDPCGGAIIASATKLIVNGQPAALLGDKVSSHGDSPHSSATLAEGSPKFICEGRLVVCVTHKATCGHPVSVGSPNTKATA